MINKESVQISGMTCAACAQRVEKAVARLEGVSSSSVNFATEKLSVTYDSETASLPKVKAAVEKIGYGVVEQAAESHVTIPIGGMTCAACAQRVEKVV
ncbi:MAG: copper ion binding protein, partial [Acetanaerobacterium sp.]